MIVTFDLDSLSCKDFTTQVATLFPDDIITFPLLSLFSWILKRLLLMASYFLMYGFLDKCTSFLLSGDGILLSIQISNIFRCFFSGNFFLCPVSWMVLIPPPVLSMQNKL